MSAPSPDERADVLVVGAGLAGLATATGLARRGHDVVLADRRPALDGVVRTTGIFVRRTLDDFPLPPEHLGPAIRRVVLHPPGPGRPLDLVSDRDEYRVGDMGPLYRASARAAVAAGVRLELGARYAGRDGGACVLEGREGRRAVRARFLVGADGARSAVARDLGLDRNRHLLVGAEEVRAVPDRGLPPTFHCVVDPSVAPGYLAWVVDDGHHAHVGVAGYADRFPGGMRRSLERFKRSLPALLGADAGAWARDTWAGDTWGGDTWGGDTWGGDTRVGQARADEAPGAVERRGGPIPVGGLLRRIAGPDGLLVGDAAGAVSPLTAGGLDPCLRQAAQAVDVLDAALRSEGPQALRRYDGAALRRAFRGRMLLRHGLAQVRSPALVRAGFPLLRTPPGRAAARAVLFGDRSFPDAPAERASPSGATA
ncbi:NAD(P)/FAD-dependent oxidoreductase [Pseudokineococcus marinus]|uniref:NAD(P)/FAD-dependent oxidoreductase n=1 Tax=Pseudokineococcus marinus TaxID=351215 RepID=A0A849BTR9_9ACTN|nr:NAD(P)/FAD-dependent oxidoreductase [Pseudokineococcus marinus]NNH24212.1 NAD(P)/FAD-dependent oxidoreductase [Pseudokineococcus marinus]